MYSTSPSRNDSGKSRDEPQRTTASHVDNAVYDDGPADNTVYDENARARRAPPSAERAQGLGVAADLGDVAGAHARKARVLQAWAAGAARAGVQGLWRGGPHCAGFVAMT